MLTAVMYHYVRPIAAGRYPGIKGLELEQFSGQLDYLQARYEVVTMDRVIANIKGAERIPENAALLTFDDGYRDHRDFVATELDRRGLQGVFYPIGTATLDRLVMPVNKVQFTLACAKDVSALVREMETLIAEHGDAFDLRSIDGYRSLYFKASALDTAEVIYLKRMLQVGLPAELRERIASEMFVRHVTKDEKSFADGLYLSVEDLQAMAAAGHHIGCHGHNHLWMSSLSIEQQRHEITEALAVHDAIGCPRVGFTFCYPFGNYNGATLSVLSDLGCAAAFTVSPGSCSPDGANRLVLPRLDTVHLPFAV
jgi:peptidoglycan/xylan/chitin deacetylase (PgdA/CDA1 family)